VLSIKEVFIMYQFSVENTVEYAAEVLRRALQLNEHGGEQLFGCAFGRGHALCKRSIQRTRVDRNRRRAKAVALIVLVRRSDIEEKDRTQGVSEGKVVHVAHAQLAHEATRLLFRRHWLRISANTSSKGGFENSSLSRIECMHAAAAAAAATAAAA
jgi:hypothetical protein